MDITDLISSRFNCYIIISFHYIRFRYIRLFIFFSFNQKRIYHNLRYNNIGYDLSLLKIEKKIVIRISLNNSRNRDEISYR